MQRPIIAGLAWLAALVVAASLIGLAACGGPQNGTPAPTSTPTAAGLQLLSGLSDEQKAAVLQVPDPGDPTKSLATLVETKTLTADELARELRQDASFAALQADAVARGFGKIVAAADLVYDNGVTVTVAPLGTCSADVLRFAYRSSAPKSHYLLAELDRVANRLTTYDENGTVTIDLATGKSSAVESPTAHHSCSFLHCFNTAMEIASDAPLFGVFSEVSCHLCADEIGQAWAAGTPVGQVLLGVSCAACLVTLTASLTASVWVCVDDPCDLCMSDSCGEIDSASNPPILCGSHGVYPPDANESTAGRYSVNQAYVCVGITWHSPWYIFGPDVADYRGTQCILESGVTGVVERCTYGCASPAPGDTVSRTCKPAPLVCDSTQCEGTAYAIANHDCHQTDGTYAVTQTVGVRGCVAAAYPNEQVCRVTETTKTMACGPCGCTAGGDCQCEPDHPQGSPYCRQVPGTSTYEVVQQWYRCQLIGQQCTTSLTDERVTFCGTAGCSNGSCGTATPLATPAATPTATPTATQCNPTACRGTVVSSSCAPGAQGQKATLTVTTRHYTGCNAAGTECEYYDIGPTTTNCPTAGCSADGTSCARGK